MIEWDVAGPKRGLWTRLGWLVVAAASLFASLPAMAQSRVAMVDIAAVQNSAANPAPSDLARFNARWAQIKAEQDSIYAASDLLDRQAVALPEPERTRRAQSIDARTRQVRDAVTQLNQEVSAASGMNRLLAVIRSVAQRDGYGVVVGNTTAYVGSAVNITQSVYDALRAQR